MKVLRALKREPLHGYALARHIKRTSNDLLRIEQRALYPAKPPEHDGRCKSSLRKRLRSVISCLWSFNNGLLEIGYRGSEQKKNKNSRSSALGRSLIPVSHSLLACRSRPIRPPEYL